MKELQKGDWSVNLEDEYYVEHQEELLAEAMKAIQSTREGRFVNLVTPADSGDPADWLIPYIQANCKPGHIPLREIKFVDQCGCGGYVTRVTR